MKQKFRLSKKRIWQAIDKATFALRGMLDIPTAKAIEYYLRNPKKK